MSSNFFLTNKLWIETYFMNENDFFEFNHNEYKRKAKLKSKIGKYLFDLFILPYRNQSLIIHKNIMGIFFTYYLFRSLYESEVLLLTGLTKN